MTPSSISQFFLSRVTILGKEKDILKLKKNKIYDQLFAVQRRHIFNNENFIASIPKKGYDRFFKKFSKILEKKKS